MKYYALAELCTKLRKRIARYNKTATTLQDLKYLAKLQTLRNELTEVLGQIKKVKPE